MLGWIECVCDVCGKIECEGCYVWCTECSEWHEKPACKTAKLDADELETLEVYLCPLSADERARDAEQCAGMEVASDESAFSRFGW